MGNFRLFCMYYAICKIDCCTVFALVFHFKFVPHTITIVYLNFIVCMLIISIICLCLTIMYKILFNIFDAEQSRIVSVKNNVPFFVSCTIYNVE